MKLLASYLSGLWYTQVRARLSHNKADARKRHKQYDKDFLDVRSAHDYIGSLLDSGNPMMVARYGFTEAQVIGKYFMKQAHLLKNYGKCGKWLYATAGFFSENGEQRAEDLDKFSKLMIEDSAQVDLIGASHVLLEDYVINSCLTPAAKLTEFNHLRIMAEIPSWGKHLKGKKVLVIHPFSETIEAQYKKRQEIWGARADDILPEFELLTYKAIQTIGGNDTDLYKDWFAALDIMKKEIASIDFDVAIIGCGAYGFPLAAECKRLGKQAIHLGGQVQMIFGILGKRWENIPFYRQFINDVWTHPSNTERPSNYKKIENGCYW